MKEKSIQERHKEEDLLAGVLQGVRVQNRDSSGVAPTTVPNIISLAHDPQADTVAGVMAGISAVTTVIPEAEDPITVMTEDVRIIVTTGAGPITAMTEEGAPIIVTTEDARITAMTGDVRTIATTEAAAMSDLRHVIIATTGVAVAGGNSTATTAALPVNAIITATDAGMTTLRIGTKNSPTAAKGHSQ
jgi:hypothetical protein